MKHGSIMPNMHCPRWIVSLMILLLAGCSSFGPKRIPGDHLSYNEAVARSANEQMLLNLVRLRYQHVPLFLAINSVLTQYTYVGEAGVSGTRESAAGDLGWSVGGQAGVLYAERPTVTFSPLAGEEFAKQLLTPIPSDRLFSLVQSGWSKEQLLIMGLERINHVENLPFQLTPSSENLEQARTFHRMVGLIMELARHRLVEVRTDETTEPASRVLVIEAGRLVGDCPPSEMGHYLGRKSMLKLLLSDDGCLENLPEPQDIIMGCLEVCCFKTGAHWVFSRLK